MRKRIMCIFITICMLIASINLVYAASDKEKSNTFVLNSISGEVLEDDIADFSLTENNISFTYQNEAFDFSINEIENKNPEIMDAKYYAGFKGDLYCNIVTYDDSICIQVIDKSKSIAGREADSLHNFTVIISDKVNDIQDVSSLLQNIE